MSSVVENNIALRHTIRHSGMVTSVAISESGNTIVYGAEDNTVKIWEKNNRGEWNHKKH